MYKNLKTLTACAALSFVGFVAPSIATGISFDELPLDARMPIAEKLVSHPIDLLALKCASKNAFAAVQAVQDRIAGHKIRDNGIFDLTAEELAFAKATIMLIPLFNEEPNRAFDEFYYTKPKFFQDLIDVDLSTANGVSNSSAYYFDEDSATKLNELLNDRYHKKFTLCINTVPCCIGQLTALRKLEVLYRNVCDIQEKPEGYTGFYIPQSFGRLTQLNNVRLEGLRIHTLPQSFAHLANLRDLTFTRCQMVNIPEPIQFLTELAHLRCNLNQIAEIPEWISCLVNLEHFELLSNQIRSLPESFGKLKKIEILALANNPLTGDLSALSGLESLKELLVHDSELTQIPESIRCLPSLEALFVYRCKLAALPEWLAEVPKLELIDAEHNKIKTIPAALKKPGLRVNVSSHSETNPYPRF